MKSGHLDMGEHVNQEVKKAKEEDSNEQLFVYI
jgi:hypothetical protein